MTDYGDEIQVKVVLLGVSGVGKSSVVHYLIYQEPMENCQATIAGRHSNLPLQVPISDPKTGNVTNQLFKLALWDTGGQERFAQVTPLFIRDSNVALVLCSADDPSSIDELSRFLELLKQHAPDAHCIFVFNKCDLLSQNELQLKIDEVKEHLMDILPPESTQKLSVIPCSAYSGLGINEQSSTGTDGNPSPAILPQLVDYLIALAEDGKIVSKNQKQKDMNIVNVNDDPPKKSSCC